METQTQTQTHREREREKGIQESHRISMSVIMRYEAIYVNIIRVTVIAGHR